MGIDYDLITAKVYIVHFYLASRGRRKCLEKMQRFEAKWAKNEFRTPACLVVRCSLYSISNQYYEIIIMAVFSQLALSPHNVCVPNERR